MAGTAIVAHNQDKALLMKIFESNQACDNAQRALKRAKENDKAAKMVRDRLLEQVNAWGRGEDPQLEINVTADKKVAAKSAKPKKPSKKKPAKSRAALNP